MHTNERRLVRLPCRKAVLCAWSVFRKFTQRGRFKWVSLCRFAQNNIGPRYLLRQYQSQTQIPVRIPGTQGTWDPSSMYHQVIQHCYHNFDPVVNPISNVRNGFIHFLGHKLTQSGEYNLGLLPNLPINQDEKLRKTFVGRGSAARDCPSSVFYTEEKAYPSPLSSNSLRQHLQNWRQWSLLFSSPMVLY